LIKETTELVEGFKLTPDIQASITYISQDVTLLLV